MESMKPRSRWMNSMPRAVSRAGACAKVARETLNAMCSTQPASRVPAGVRARLAGEHRQQPAVARIEIEMILVGLAQVGLLEHERHPQRPLPEIDGALLGGPDKGDVVDA